MDHEDTRRRWELIERALLVLPQSFPFDQLNERGIRLAAIVELWRIRRRAVISLAALSEKSDDYICGFFDQIVDTLEQRGLSRCLDELLAPPRDKSPRVGADGDD